MGRETAAALASRGWAVVDEFFSPSFAEGLRDDVVTLAALGSMLPNKTYFANPSGGRHLFSKPFIFEVDLLQARFLENPSFLIELPPRSWPGGTLRPSPLQKKKEAQPNFRSKRPPTPILPRSSRRLM